MALSPDRTEHRRRQQRGGGCGARAYPIGDRFVPLCAEPLRNYKCGCLFSSFWDTRILIFPGSSGGNAWAPMTFSPQTNLAYIPANVMSTVYIAKHEVFDESRGGVQDGRWRRGLPSPSWRAAVRHPYRDGSHDQQDRLATTNEVAAGFGRRLTEHRRRSDLSRRTRRQSGRARHQKRRRALEIPNRCRRECARVHL